MEEALQIIINVVLKVPIPLGYALVNGLMLYACYLYSQLKGDKEGIKTFIRWIWTRGSDKAIFGLISFAILFILVYGVAKEQLPFLGVAAISWGPWSALSALLRIKNGKK